AGSWKVQIFRPEASDAMQIHGLGEVRIATPIRLRVYGWALVLVAAAFMIFGLTASLSRKESFAGIVVPAAGVTSINATTSAVVSRVFVAEGDIVRVGDRLF